jgi:putative endonuclease
MHFGTGDLGRAGERRAAWFYILRGYSVLARNYRCPRGEIDLIVRRRRSLVFVEVKSRQQTRTGEPEEAVDAAKQMRVVRSAEHFLATARETFDSIRFDVLSLVWNGWWFRVTHLRDVIRPTADPQRPWRWDAASR